MILKDLTWTGAVVVNGVQYESLQEAAAAGVANIEAYVYCMREAHSPPGSLRTLPSKP